ncbi:hypothetical protein [Nocardia sp. NPDC049707]|uniref:hypothetical protein n=1 Tax=Nocardia sp. NPDC049707 TaxID=3154735 RepID=UPI00341B3EBB
MAVPAAFGVILALDAGRVFAVTVLCSELLTECAASLASLPGADPSPVGLLVLNLLARHHLIEFAAILQRQAGVGEGDLMGKFRHRHRPVSVSRPRSMPGGAARIAGEPGSGLGSEFASVGGLFTHRGGCHELISLDWFGPT